MAVVVAALLLVNANDTGVAPVVLAVTLYEPAVPFAVALALAWPPAMVTFAVAPPPFRTAEALTAGAVKMIIPPLTGSAPLPVMDATRGDANAVVMVVLCGVPLRAESVKPRDSNAPMSTVVLTILPKPVPR